MRFFRLFAATTLSCLWLDVVSAFACAVCFGDPNSSLTKGANAGILILLGVVGVVLGAIVGVTLFWVHRARRVQQASLGPVVVGLQGRFHTSAPGVNGQLVMADTEG